MLQLVFTIPNAGVVIAVMKCILKVTEGVSFVRRSVENIFTQG
jgi:hypothetical protein